MRPNFLARPLAALALLACLVSSAFAAPERFPMPDGTEIVREATDVAAFLAAWKAAAHARVGAVAQPATTNQLQYDAHGYDLDLTFTPATTTVAGTVRLKASVTSGTISTLDLDLRSNMTVSAATSAGGATTWSRVADVLTLNLDRVYSTGEIVDVTVTYSGTPTGGSYFGFQTVNGRPIIWSLSEAYGARSWWPCKDAPEDKADSVDIRFTAPQELIVASNGTLVNRTVNGANATTQYRERYPITTYLVSIAAYPYVVTDDWYRPTPTDSMLIRFHNYPESAGAYAPVQAKVKDMIGVFAGLFGEYPFIDEKYGHAQFPFSGGMEHQTCTSLGTTNESVVAHELTHQWWGDLVTCRDFGHIWLNEGFASYGEALWSESIGGAAAYHADMNASRFFGPGTVWVPNPEDEGRVFDSNLSYNKGSWVLHMLRHVLGDDVFFDALRAYYVQWGYRSAATEDFQEVCESVSGRDLDDFFQQWIYGERYPVYRYAWTAAAGGGGWDVTLTLDQAQPWQIFNMPVDVTVTTASGETTFVVQDSLASQTFVLHVDAAPMQVEIDRDDWILRTVETFVVDPPFDRSLLLVNGVDWAVYGSEIASAYADDAFSGAYAYDFWDVFATPAGGYPAGVPAPLGHGEVPPDVLGRYRAVVWVGNNFNGDLEAWNETPVLSYLRAGGNLLLMTRMGNLFLGDSLRAYLGINWALTSTTLNDCLPTRPGLVAMTPSSMNLCSVFDTVRTTPESHLLFRASAGFTPNRGIGAVRIPPGGAGTRPTGGRFAFVSGRPYRWNHAPLAANVEAILGAWFLEPAGLAAVDDAAAAGAGRLTLEPVRPNPSSGPATLRFTLPRSGTVRLTLVDVAGRRTRTITDATFAAGSHDVTWDGRDAGGSPAPAGIYWARIESGSEVAVRRLVRMR